MKLAEKVNGDIAAAMKAQDQRRLSALRMLKAAITNKGVEKGRDLDDGEVLQVVSSLVKQRRDSIEQFARAGRTDLVERHAGEFRIEVVARVNEIVGAYVFSAVDDFLRDLASARHDHDQHAAASERHEVDALEHR